MNDQLGERMKSQYEHRTRYYLPRRTYTIIRLDGKAFHTYTKNLEKPFDAGFIDDMNETAKYLCENVQGCKFGYVQSDEISLLLTDFDTITTDSWFDGNIQKIVSISSSLATAEFNQLRLMRFTDKNSVPRFPCGNISSVCNSEDILNFKLAVFDSRVFTIPDRTEVENYFIWRQQDAVRNSIQSLAQSKFSHKELEKKNTSQLQEMIFQKDGTNWDKLDCGLKRGRMVVKKDELRTTDSNTGEKLYSSVWVVKSADNFTSPSESIDYHRKISLYIPKYE